MRYLPVLTFALILSACCGGNSEPPPDASSCDVVFNPKPSGSPCTSVADCGNSPVCIAVRCEAGACAYDLRAAGEACSQCNVKGSCDGAGSCVGQPCAGAACE